ncbi:NAD-dependent epimerase/dehydratase family protein [Martelella sp. AD-3]|uniref:NAD-dependent epimerase/dehydratase family protein n=1 Tax=Martelella sp. AD-3 TaxID=686597 RepID=UPI0004679659|nr:NAD-dependent epimerase/dehydratase family protein [Martelella sp. AD-3]AMM84507.1 hypothetical protein AZF01_09170 [Martelella sp. AD-3]
MNIVIIGGSGFVGRHFVEAVLAGGHAVTVVGRSALAQHSDDDRVTYLSGGLWALAKSKATLENADAICHFASSTIPSSSNADPIADIESNLIGTVALLEAMREAGNKRIIYLSSGGAVYGSPRQTPIHEDHPTNPISSYGIVKLAVEKYLAMYSHAHGFSTAVVRPANPYGPGQGKIGQLGAVTTFLNLALTGGTAKIWGDGSAVRDFVHVLDLCDLLLRIVETGAEGIYNCGDGEGTSLNELIDTIETITGQALRREHLPARSFDPPKIILDISKARSEIGWEPKTSLHEGVEHMVEELKRGP